MSYADGARNVRQQHADSPQAALRREIESCRRKLALQAAARRLLVLLAIAAIPPLLFVVADHIEPAGVSRATASVLAQYWRWLLGIACLALLVVTFWRRLNPLFAARVLERAGGIDHNSIVNAVLLQHEPAAVYASSVAAEQATADLSEHWPPRVGESGAMRLPLAIVSVVVLAWIGYGLLATKPVWPSVARFFGASLPAPTATTLEQVRPRPGEAVHAGQALGLEFTARGGSVRQVVLELLSTDASGKDQTARYELKAGTEPNATWQLTLAPHEVSRDIHFRCTANDAVLTGAIPVLPLPALAGLEIELQPPAYSGLPVQVVSNPELEVLAGTRATFRAFANTVVQDGTFVLSNGHETRTRMDVDQDNRRHFGVSVLLVEGGQYCIEFRDSLGAGVEDPPTHSIALRSDDPPSISIVEPTESEMPDGVVDVTRHTALAATIEDDLRVAEVLFVRADAGVLVRTPLKPDLDASGQHARVRLPTADLPLKPGQQMRAWFEVLDNRVLLDGTPAPQMARSRELTLMRPAVPARGRASTTDRTASAEPPPAPEAPREPADPPPGGGEPQTNGPGGQQGHGPGSTSVGSGEGGFERELKRFVDENGGMARDVGRRIPKPESDGEPGGDQPQDTPASQPAGSPPAGGDREQPQSRPAPGQGEPSATQPALDQAAQSQPSSSPTDSSPSSQSSGAAAASNPDSQPSDSPQCQGKPPVSESGAQSDQSPTSRQSKPGDDGQCSAPQDSGAAQPVPGSEQSGGGTGDERTPEEPASQPFMLPNVPRQPDWRERAPAPQTEGLTETLDLLEWMDRGGTVDEAMLIELGWPADKAAAFVKSLERLHEYARQAGALGELRTLRMRLALGDPNVQQGAGFSSAAGTAVDQAQPHQDNLHRIAPPPEQDVPNELRPLLDAYYRALAERQRAAP